MNIRFLSTVLIFAISVMNLSGCDDQANTQKSIAKQTSTTAQKSITVQEFEQILESGVEHDIISAMNRVKQNQESQDLMAFTLKLWGNETREYPEMPWQILNSDAVRIEIANVLAQASNNGLIQIDREDLRSYAKQVIGGANEQAKTTAVLTLGLISSAADIDVLKSVALLENPRTFRASVIALNGICDVRAVAALAEIKDQVQDSENRKFLNESNSQSIGNKKCS